MSFNIMLNLSSKTIRSTINYLQRRYMPVNVPPSATGKRRFRLSVETDPHKLVNYCCGLNYHLDEPLIKLKPDEEYPDWLWTLRLGPKPNSWELEEGTKEYHIQLREEKRNQNHLNLLKADQPRKVVGKVLKQQEDYLKRIRFAALAHLEDDVGLELDSMESNWYSNKIARREYYMPMRKDSVIYMDKVTGGPRKNFFYDVESSFKKGIFMAKRPSNKIPAIQDSKRRHRYSVN